MATFINFNKSNNRLECNKTDRTGKVVNVDDVCVGIEPTKLYQPLNEREIKS